LTHSSAVVWAARAMVVLVVKLVHVLARSRVMTFAQILSLISRQRASAGGKMCELRTWKSV
jgi:hypothetical protein